MKKRLFRTLLMLCLLLAALTVITLTAMASTAADYSMRFYGNTLPQENPPVTEINMNATFYCRKCKKTTVLTPSSIITLTGIQFPVDNDHHKMALTGSISTVTCSNCNNLIGPINFNVTFTAQNGYFCHNGARYELLEASGSQTIDSGSITFTIGTTPQPLQACSTRPATCGQVGLRKDCYHCEGCDKYFLKSNAQDELSADDIISPTQDHNYDLNTGVCSVCHAQSPAHLGDQFYATFEDALKAYNAGIGGTLTVYFLPENTTIDLERSGTLVINNGAAASKITMSAGLTVTIENAGTINAIKMGESSTLTIENSGTIKAIEMDKSSTVTIKNGSSGKIGSIGMNQPGTLSIDNSGTVDLLKTSVIITGDGTRTINVTNRGTITRLEAPNTMLTVRNDGEIVELLGYIHPANELLPRENMVTLERGAGIYKTIYSIGPDRLDPRGWAYAAADFSKLLLAGDYFYFREPGKVDGNTTYWYTDRLRITYTNTLTDVYFTCYPFSSIEVTGKAGNSAPVELTPGVDGRLTMTVKAGQTVTLTGGVTLPDQGLKSDQENLAYRWNCNAPGGRGSGNVFTFEDILYGEYDLTLTVQDNEYHHSKKIYIHIKAEKPADEKIEIFLRKPTPSDGTTFTKRYDGTVDPPSGVNIEFYVKNGSGVERTIPVPSDCYHAIIAYKNKNCSDDNPITVTVELTETGTQNYTLGENGTATYTVPGKITQTDTTYTISPTAEAHVGDSVFQSLTFNGIWWCRTEPRSLFNPVTPGTTIMVEDEPLSVTFYRLHPSNITSAVRDDDIQFISDPEIDEPLSKDSVFKYAGKYYIYAVVQPTTNYEGKITNCRVINVQDTEASSEHHKSYDGGWDGTTTVPIKAGEEKSVYLSGSYSTIYTELLLSQGKNLTLCLNGKTLSATNSITRYNHIRVTDSAALAIDDCVGTGTVKGAAVNGGWGGIAYVKNGTLTIQNGKFTGGTASTGGGAIVVDKDGTLNLYSGEISGNTVTNGNGGAIYIKSGGTVNIYGGTIKNNHVYSGNGGAIYVEAGGTLNLYGGTITGNTASGLGGGIYVEEGGTLKIQGNPVVTGNTAGGKDSNVYLAGGPLFISDQLGSNAQIGISVNALSYPALFATSTEDYSAHFIPDDANTFVLRTDGGLTLAVKPSATLNGTELTVTTGDKYAHDACILFVAEYGKDGRMLAVQSKTVEPGKADYTFTVKNSGAKLKCFLLRKDTYTPLFEAFTPQ